MFKMTMISLWIGVYLFAGQPALAHASHQPPEGAKEIAKQYFQQIVERIVFSDIPSDWGFKEEIGNITFSELYPIYNLNADFAFGHSDKIISDTPSKWVAVIFQDNQPVNAIGTQLGVDGNFMLPDIGYPSELPAGLLNLKNNEIIIHDFPKDEYYVYTEKTNSIRKLEMLKGTSSLSNSISKEQFQNMLMERYKNIDEWGEDVSGGFKDVASKKSIFNSPSPFIYPIIIVLVIGVILLYFRRRLNIKK